MCAGFAHIYNVCKLSSGKRPGGGTRKLSAEIILIDLQYQAGQGSESMADFDLYRKSLCGGSLNEALNKFVDDGKITPDLAKKVLIQFEKVRREGGRVFLSRHLDVVLSIWDSVWVHVLHGWDS